MRKYIPFTLVTLLLSLSKAYAGDTPPPSVDQSSPLACFKSVQSRWNLAQSPPSESIKLTEELYHGFATCALLAVKSHDDNSYFADTIGAMYAQSWLGVLHKRKHADAAAHQHFALARDLNKLARSLLTYHDPMGTVGEALLKNDREYVDLDSGKTSAYGTVLSKRP